MKLKLVILPGTTSTERSGANQSWAYCGGGCMKRLVAFSALDMATPYHGDRPLKLRHTCRRSWSLFKSSLLSLQLKALKLISKPLSSRTKALKLISKPLGLRPKSAEVGKQAG